MRKTIVGVMGPGGGATELDTKEAFELGALIAGRLNRSHRYFDVTLQG